MKLYAGNLPYNLTEDDLTTKFKEFGAIDSLKIITDRMTGNSRGFGFVEMSDSDAHNAIQGLNKSELQGNTITVKEANEKRESGRGAF